MAITFDTLLKDLLPSQKRLHPFYDIDKKQTKFYLHLPTFFAIWKEKNQATTLKRGEVLTELKTKPYYSDHNCLKRIKGKPMRCLVINYGKQPSEELLAFIQNPKPKENKILCSCDLATIVARGCQCGGA